MKSIIAILLIVATSCGTIKYKNTTENNLPELGTLGVFTNYAFEKDHQAKTVVHLSKGVRLNYTEIKVSERKLFNKKDSLSPIEKDSTLISLEILDKVSLINQINADQEIIKYISPNSSNKVVSQVTIHFLDKELTAIKKADEIYLIQNKQNTLSLELRKDNKVFDQIEFSSGTITSFKALELCWGQNKRRDIEIFDLVPPGTSCGDGTYKSAKKVKKKNEFKF